MLYLDTSAIRQLAEQPEHADVRTELSKRVKKKVLFCTSILAVEEIITSTSDNIPARHAALRLAEELVPEGVMWHWHPIVQAWVDPGGLAGRHHVRVRAWDRRFSELLPDEVADLRRQQEVIQERARQFREVVGRKLPDASELSGPRHKASYWTVPDNIIQEADDRIRLILDHMGALLHSLGRITGGIDHERMVNHRWVRTCARHLMVGVVRRKYTRAGDDKLRGELYDNTHIAFSSVADTMVTHDKWLRHSLSPLPQGNEGGARAIGLDGLLAYLDQLGG